MRPVDVKKFKYNDKLASKRRQRLHVKTFFIGLVIIAVAGGIGYALFYAPWLKVTDISYEGLTDGHQADVEKVIDKALGYKILGIPVGRDILFVRAGSLVADLTSQFSFIEDVSIQKDYFHTIKVTATERQAAGVWCFDSSAPIPDCRYFDSGGITFGHAIQSSGVLLLNIDDMRVQSASVSLATVDSRFLKAIQIVVPVFTSQNVKVKNITIPVGTYTELDILVGENYIIKLSLDSDIQSQLDIFRIFRDQKITNGGLRPQYVDLRFDGRVYFK